MRGQVPDVYRYDEVPRKLRVQIVHIVSDMLHGGEDENLRHNSNVMRAYD